jgi:hypothetical protein
MITPRQFGRFWATWAMALVAFAGAVGVYSPITADSKHPRGEAVVSPVTPAPALLAWEASHGAG